MENEIIHEKEKCELLAGFAHEGWKTMGDSVYIECKGGLDFIEYKDLGNDADGASLELSLWKDGQLRFQFCQEVSNTEILNYVAVPPFCEENWNVRDDMYGVVYGPDGCMMDRVKETGGQPKKIDMDKTIGLFLKQVAERKFDVPVLVSAV
ncbi:MAG: hypothetical protein ACYC5G_06315 [Candidatus Doudnabacteria bacterium]